jgi:hypothetical protein
MLTLDQPPQWSSTLSQGPVAEFGDLIRSLRGLLDPYRPECHYMRGPGPKWRAKHAPAPAILDSALRHCREAV